MLFSKKKNTDNMGITVSQKTANKIGLFGAMSVIIGAVIGIGIFFKNGGVFNNNNGNALGIILSWVIAFVIALATAFSYGEIVSCKTKGKNAGLPGWSERLCGYQWGRFLKISQPLFYYSIYVFVIGCFSAEALLNVFMSVPGQINHHIGLVFAVSLGLIVLFLLTNYFCLNFSKRLSKVTTLIKFIPLIVIAFVGIIAGSLNTNHNLFVNPGNVYSGGGEALSGAFSFNGVIASLPAILFAFDSFLVVGNISSDVKNPTKNIPLSTILSLVVSGALYIFITIGQICTGCGNAYDVFSSIFGKNTTGAQICSVFVSIFILIAILGVLNSLSMGAMNSCATSVENNTIAWSYKIKKITKNNYLLNGLIVLSIMVAFYWVVIGIPSILIDTDELIDGISNVAVLIYFGIYAVTVAFSMKNHVNRKCHELTWQKGQLVAGLISTIGCFGVIAYYFASSFIVNFANGLATNENVLGWGLFCDNNKLLLWEQAVFFLAITIWFVIVPFLNDWIINNTTPFYKSPFVWEKPKKYDTSFEVIRRW